MIENIVDVFQSFFDSRMENVHTCLPGKIVSYKGHGARLAQVKPLVKLKALNNEDVELPVIDNVPIVFPSSSKFNLLFPIVKDDGVLILFTETGIGNYLAGSGQVVNADDRTRFSLTDAVAIPGLWTSKNIPTEKVIELTDIGILELMGGSEALVLGDTLESQLNTFLNALGGITPGNEAANAVALGVIKAAALAMQATLSAIKSTKIKGS